jgi:hypothetical protein
MNPYLEQPGVWRRFHTQVLTAFVAQLVPQLVPNCVVQLEERISPHEPMDGPDRFLEIRDRRGRALVTVIELLSPSNKRPGPERLQYLAKRAAVLSSPAHLVEIDLLRGGPPLPAIGTRPEGPFSVIISRSGDRPQAGFWPIGLRDRLPVVPIPVHPEDPPARLDLKAALHKVYDEGGFAYLLYDGEPEPPLDSEDSAWARQVLAGVA